MVICTAANTISKNQNIVSLSFRDPRAITSNSNSKFYRSPDIMTAGITYSGLNAEVGELDKVSGIKSSTPKHARRRRTNSRNRRSYALRQYRRRSSSSTKPTTDISSQRHFLSASQMDHHDFYLKAFENYESKAEEARRGDSMLDEDHENALARDSPYRTIKFGTNSNSHKRRDAVHGAVNFFDWNHRDEFSTGNSESRNPEYSAEDSKSRFGEAFSSKFDSTFPAQGKNKESEFKSPGLKWVILPPKKLVMSNSTGGHVECRVEGGETPPRIKWVQEDGRTVHDVSIWDPD